MKRTVVFEKDYSEIKDALTALIGKKINVSEFKTKNKTIVKKGVVTTVSDNLFCFEVPLGKNHVDTCSYSFFDIRLGKVEVKELGLNYKKEEKGE